MTASDDWPRVVPAPATCQISGPGHNMNLIQAKLSFRHGQEVPARIAAVDDSGAILFEDGLLLWNHWPERLEEVLARLGPDFVLGGEHVLRIKVPHDYRHYSFSVSSRPSPCRAAQLARIPRPAPPVPRPRRPRPLP